jgi:hypothetical protein
MHQTTSKQIINKKYSFGFKVFDRQQDQKITEDDIKLDTLPQTEPALIKSQVIITNVSSVFTPEEGPCLLVLVSWVPYRQETERLTLEHGCET